MSRYQNENQIVSRRTFLRRMAWAPVLFLPAPLYAGPFRRALAEGPQDRISSSSTFADLRFTPRYPAKSPLEDVLRHVIPGADEYISEKYALEIAELLGRWSRDLKASPPALDVLAQLLDTSIEASSLTPTDQHSLRSGGGIEVFRRRFGAVVTSGRERFLSEIKSYMAGMSRMEMAEFEIIGIEEITSPLPKVNVDIRYDFVGMPTNTGREERVGQWRTQWVRGESGAWRVLRWEATDETVSRARGPVFVDVTAQTLGHTESYRNQMLRGVDHWRTVLDGACGIDVYGNHGVAAGDFDNDGFDDLYVCQPPGLPNRLYRNRGDGSLRGCDRASWGGRAGRHRLRPVCRFREQGAAGSCWSCALAALCSF